MGACTCHTETRVWCCFWLFANSPTYVYDCATRVLSVQQSAQFSRGVWRVVVKHFVYLHSKHAGHIVCLQHRYLTIPARTMRRKKHKHTRKTVRLFRIQFGFRQPFKVLQGHLPPLYALNWHAVSYKPICTLLQVLVDGNFIHGMQQLRCVDGGHYCTQLIMYRLTPTEQLYKQDETTIRAHSQASRWHMPPLYHRMHSARVEKAGRRFCWCVSVSHDCLCNVE